ncbi:unnamed protein product [Euphydryas editha]|uniref:Reverse transcriptase domain-containing protein n=1 Tax=Euphydryas editha TaxID=104508 RepID=A0AAU9TM44_EUPED|nr:unnamed protein product [Euphydryas editha]
MSNQGDAENICNGFAATFDEEIQRIQHVCNVKLLKRNDYVKEPDRCMRWQPVSDKYVDKIIKSMNSHKSPGSDLVRMADIQLVSDKIAPVIARLVNLTVKQHKFPGLLKEAIIRPIHKKGDRKKYINYRPIAILSCIDKIIEKCIVDQLSNYLQTNKILDNAQHGFQRGKGTNTLLSKFTNDINSYLGRGMFVVAVFFDNKKAFDTLEKDTLLHAIEECGVGEPLNEWFRDYLTARSYRVKVGEAYSTARGVRCGVPQGSGCGPVCYLMHVNSLTGVLHHCTPYMFADDLCVLCAGRDLAETCALVQQDLDAVVKWNHDNGIILNSEKTKLIVIHSPYMPLKDIPNLLYTHSYNCFHNNNVKCSCKPIEKVKCVTYLGVKIDEYFSWSEHINFICDKLRAILYKFYYLSYKVPTSTLRLLYTSLVESIVDYALDCYGLTFKTYIEKIEKMQIKFLKLLVNNKVKNKYKNDYKKIFKFCNILPVSIKHKYLLVINNHYSSGDHNPLLTKVINTHNTRAMTSGKYVVPRVNNYYEDRTLKKRLPYLLNSLPQDINHNDKKTLLKIRLKKHLLNLL